MRLGGKFTKVGWGICGCGGGSRLCWTEQIKEELEKLEDERRRIEEKIKGILERVKT